MLQCTGEGVWVTHAAELGEAGIPGGVSVLAGLLKWVLSLHLWVLPP